MNEHMLLSSAPSEEVPNRKQERQETLSRIEEAMAEAPLEKLYALVESLDEALKRLGEETAVAIRESEENPDELLPKIAVLNAKENTTRALEIQGTLQSVLSRRQREAS